MKSYGVKIEMKATEQYFPVVLFMLPHKVVLTLNLWMKSYGVTIQMNPFRKLFSSTFSFFLYLNVWIHGFLYFLHVLDFVNFDLNWLIQGLS